MPSTENQNEKPKDNKHWLEYAIFVFVVLTAAGTIAAACYTRSQWQTAEKQLGVMRDTEIKQLRAYLIVSHGPLVMTDSDASVDIKVSHAGMTPAYKVRLDVRMEVGHFPLDERVEKLFSPVDIMGLKKYEYASLFGTDVKTETVKAESPGTMIPMVKNPEEFSGAQRRFYVHGSVRYFDVFEMPERRYDFCYSFHPKYNPAGSEEGCEKYNKPD